VAFVTWMFDFEPIRDDWSVVGCFIHDNDTGDECRE
jgi:hypothetical protein